MKLLATLCVTAACVVAVTAQSAKIISRTPPCPPGRTIRKNDDGAATPSASPIASPAASITRRVGAAMPATIASASPAATIAAARIRGFSSIRLARLSLTPRAPTSAAIWAGVTGGSGTGSASPSSFSRATALAMRGSSHSGNTTRALAARAASKARARAGAGDGTDMGGASGPGKARI